MGQPTQQARIEWREVFQFKGKRSMLYLYENSLDGSIDIVQLDDDNKSITTRLESDVIDALLLALGA